MIFFKPQIRSCQFSCEPHIVPSFAHNFQSGHTELFIVETGVRYAIKAHDFRIQARNKKKTHYALCENFIRNRKNNDESI